MVNFGYTARMTILLYILIGAAIGCLTSWMIETKTGSPVAISVCVIGGVIGGVASQLIIPSSALIFGIVGAVIGASLLIWMFTTALR